MIVSFRGNIQLRFFLLAAQGAFQRLPLLVLARRRALPDMDVQPGNRRREAEAGEVGAIHGAARQLQQLPDPHCSFIGQFHCYTYRYQTHLATSAEQGFGMLVLVLIDSTGISVSYVG